jgi:hypothetical protein
LQLSTVNVGDIPIDVLLSREIIDPDVAVERIVDHVAGMGYRPSSGQGYGEAPVLATRFPERQPANAGFWR